MSTMDGNDDTTNVGLIIVGAIVFLLLLFSCAQADTLDPTREQRAEAARIAGLESPWPVWSIDRQKMPGARLGTVLPKLKIVLVEETWAVGGLTRIVHEYVHARQLAGANRPITDAEECEASQVAAAWADENGFINEAAREWRYGSSYCR